MATKKKINSKQKGARGERDSLKKFETWWNPHGEESKRFFRTPGSGGLATMGFRFQNVDIAGDITTPDSTFPFCVEIKNCEGWSLEQLLTAPKSAIYMWWAQTIGECPSHLVPLLVFKKNHHSQLFCMRKCDFLLDLPRPCVTLHLADGTEVLIGNAEDLWKTDPDVWRKKNGD